ncbi:hypothetical protein EV421DRAFT_1855944 [Armillaria borealis]|uniref:Fungal N-terminal domain-containing protein n=1 Tax=Armillaria borealis TaxID=47425 RepID=A0AA39MEL9_9AGAR|nr:hypothetical protein EV421DRAFT_1855944 [Armillaria borealis]
MKTYECGDGKSDDLSTKKRRMFSPPMAPVWETPGSFIIKFTSNHAVWALNQSLLPPPAILITMPTNTSRKPRHGSKTIPASIQIAHIVKGLGDMVPIVGGFVRGIAETASVLFENLEQSKNNKEDMQDLAEEIIEIVKLIHDAGIQASATPEGIKYTSSLQTACLEFQEYLSDVLTQVNEVSRKNGGVRGKIMDVLASRDIKEDIGRHRKAVNDARKNFDSQLSLNILQVSLKTLQVVTSNTGTISRVDEQLSPLRSTPAMTVPAKLATNTTRSPVHRETQITGPSYTVPGGTDPAEEFEELNSGASFGYYVKLCKERLLQLHTFNDTAPLLHAPYMVAWHQSRRVRMIRFSEVGPARAVYNAVSTKWAKILMDRQRSQELLSHGGGRWIEQCKEEVLRRPLFQDSISPSHSWPYIVAFHHQDRVRMIGLSIEGCARVVYDAISTKFAKILMDTRRSEVLASYGISNYTKECREEVRRLDALQSATPLQSASYIVAFHQNTRVRMLGFSEERAARAVYGAVSIHWAKVLMDRRNSGSLASHGYAHYVQQCEEEVLRYDFHEPTQ